VFRNDVRQAHGLTATRRKNGKRVAFTFRPHVVNTTNKRALIIPQRYGQIGDPTHKNTIKGTMIAANTEAFATSLITLRILSSN
jgi:hypothetical protein